MDAVVITYPGHFFTTALCIRSLRRFYPDINTIYILCDDLANCDWENYFSDCHQYYSRINYGFKLIPHSNLAGIEKCNYGWWRQQLVKLNLDCLVPGDSWLVIDGDIVLDQRIDLVGITPVHIRGSADDPMTKSVSLYIDKMLGQSTPLLTDHEGRFALTSSVPFRHLVADNLKELRARITKQLNGDLIQEHIRMFYSGEIVAFDSTSTHMVMHEWELIEAYNQMRFPGKFPVVNIGSGYHLDTHTSALETEYKYRVNPYADSQMGRIWFERQHIFVPDQQWDKASKIKK